MANKEFTQAIHGGDEFVPSPNELLADDETRSEDGKYVSEALYWAEYYDRGDFSYEWNNGILEEKPVGDYAQFQLYLWFMGLLKDFLHVYPLARMIGLEMGFRMALPHKTTIRKPDLAVVLDSNPFALGDRDRSYKGIFDLCIESLSDSSKREMARDTITKRIEYAAAGVKEYYILDEQGRETSFYRLGAGGIYELISPQAGVISSSVLPGFQWRLSDLYRRPEPPQMIADPVYSAFASPYFRAERLRADEEKARADEERAYSRQVETKLLREQQRAERYAAKLKALGIAADDLE